MLGCGVVGYSLAMPCVVAAIVSVLMSHTPPSLSMSDFY